MSAWWPSRKSAKRSSPTRPCAGRSWPRYKSGWASRWTRGISSGEESSRKRRAARFVEEKPERAWSRARSSLRREVRNNVGSTKDQVQVSYDVSNEFFRLWLDERMNYTSAVFENENQSLEAAQLNKLRILAEFAHITSESKVVDIGCGWGANLEFLSTARGLKSAYGVTLPSAHMEEINRRNPPGTKPFFCHYKYNKPKVKDHAAES